jgi:hypothetical protein
MKKQAATRLRLLRERTRTEIGGEIPHQRRGAADRGQRGGAVGDATQDLAMSLHA